MAQQQQEDPFYTIKAGCGGCPWCGARYKNDLVIPLPMIVKCECGGMWVMTTPPKKQRT